MSLSPVLTSRPMAPLGGARTPPRPLHNALTKQSHCLAPTRLQSIIAMPPRGLEQRLHSAHPVQSEAFNFPNAELSELLSDRRLIFRRAFDAETVILG